MGQERSVRACDRSQRGWIVKILGFAILAIIVNGFTWILYDSNVVVPRRIERFIKNNEIPAGGWKTPTVTVKVDSARYDSITFFGMGDYGRGIIGWKEGKIISRFFIPAPPISGFVVNGYASYVMKFRKPSGFKFKDLNFQGLTQSDLSDIEGLIKLFKDKIENEHQGVGEEEFEKMYPLSMAQISRSMNYLELYIPVIKKNLSAKSK
jgi:hypothetical protein